ncbi:MAG: DUF5117 domain-containing protein [Calditrichaeota bacterium]|nr:MAG: DUF5117 domain-containing protein [Calditrichota bacterium]
MKKLVPCLWLIIIVLYPLYPQTPASPKAAKDTTQQATAKKEKKKKKLPGKPFEELIEHFEVVEGLFTLYQNKDDGKVYLEIKPEQFDQVYLCSITRESGDGYFFDSGAILDEFPFFFTRQGEQVFFVQKNLRFRADKDAAISRAVESNIPNSIKASTKVLSQPHPERGSILVDASDLFVQDVGMVGYITGRAKMGFSLDKKGSFISKLSSFPMNTEIEVTLHFKSSKPYPIFTLEDSRSMLHRYHYSLSQIPKSDYKPRKADDRVGHFITLYQDYTSVLEPDPYTRYINRWNLEKAEPRFKKSPPKKPIVYWLENTIPVEYRDAVKEGILLWNQAFARVGFENAIEVRQMPDDADWDPADIRYNTIRWIVQPGGGYAVGPSRANPFTGELYNADIRISADMWRYFFTEYQEFVTPTGWQNEFFQALSPENPHIHWFWEQRGMGNQSDETAEMLATFFKVKQEVEKNMLYRQCDFARGMMHQMAFGWSMLNARGQMSSEEIKQYLHDAIVAIVAHEVGHTLGLRHNFKASSIYSLDKLEEKNFLAKHSLTGSVMDYIPVNIPREKDARGHYFQTSLGPYDYWAIEYAYTPYDPSMKISEEEMLEKIARKVAEPELQYGTDEDAFGLSPRSIDPTATPWDLGQNPLRFYDLRLELANDLWSHLLEKFEKPGERYPTLRRVFSQGISEYFLAGISASKYIGGIYQHRDHVGDPNQRPPLKIVPAQKQREALDFLIQRYFSPNSFQFSPELLTKLAPERQWDFEGTVFRMTRLDYPIHGMVQLLQAITLFRLYDPIVLQRIQDNEIRFSPDETPFTMAELFKSLRNAIWKEAMEGKNVNSFRRELQRIHLSVLTEMVIKIPPMLPHDAITLARADLIHLKKELTDKLSLQNLNDYTRAHWDECLSRINDALTATAQRRY